MVANSKIRVLREKVLATELFDVKNSHEQSAKLLLKGTRYIVYFSLHGELWWYIQDNRMGLIHTTFREVFNKVSPEVQEKLIYHLDLFSGST